jgi:hypothetical protein
MRASIWRSLFEEKGWLEGDALVVQKDVRVLLNFNGGHHQRDPMWVIEQKGDFLVFRPRERAVQFHLWEEISSIAR